MQLSEVLKTHKISQAKLANSIYKPDGTPFSVAMVNQLAKHGIYPKSVPATDIQDQIEYALNNMGVGEEINWEMAESSNSQPSSSDNKMEIPEMQILSQQAKEIFGLAKSPFIDDVQSREDVYLSPEQRYIRQTMYQAAKHGGFIAIVGESGAGKTTLKRDLLEHLRESNEQVIVVQPQTIDKTRLTAPHLCDAIIEDVSQGSAHPKRSMEAKARQIKKLLTESSRAGFKHCIVIDEAHDLTIPMLKYLKRFWELEDGMKRLLSIVLIGQPELKIKLNERNADVREVARRCEQVELQPLNAFVGEYLTHKLNRIGKPFAEIFSHDAMTGLTARLTQPRGRDTVSLLYPLIVNNTVIAAMNEAAKIGQDKVTADLFEGV